MSSSSTTPPPPQKTSNLVYVAIILAIVSGGGGVLYSEITEDDLQVVEHSHPLEQHDHDTSHIHDTTHTHPQPEPFNAQYLESQIMQLQIDVQTLQNNSQQNHQLQPVQQTPTSSSSCEQCQTIIRLEMEEQLRDIEQDYDRDNDRIHDILNEFDEQLDEIRDTLKQLDRNIDNVDEVIEETTIDITNIFASFWAICERYQWKCEGLAEDYGWD